MAMAGPRGRQNRRLWDVFAGPPWRAKNQADREVSPGCVTAAPAVPHPLSTHSGQDSISESSRQSLWATSWHQHGSAEHP